MPPARLTVLTLGLIVAIANGSLAANPKTTPTKADISYGLHPHQLLDVYLPPKGEGPFPVVIWFGGLWKPSKNVPPVHAFFPAGCAAVSVQTRVMEDAIQAKITPPISVCLLDARRAVQFVRLHAAEWNLDPQRIAVVGSSQGALPALYVGCAGERANPAASDPVERISTKVTCVGAHRSQPSVDPKRMQEWVPGVEWGVPAWGCNFAESLKKRAELLPLISQWTPEALLNKDTPPIYFENNWGLTKPDGVGEMDYLVHSPRWAVGFQKLAQERGATCYVKFPGHLSEKYADIWDFLVKELAAGNVNSVGMTMVSIPAGTFKMGQEKRNVDYGWHCSVEIDQGADWDEVPVRQVEITKPFELSATEVTNAQYEIFEPNHRATRRMSKKISSEDDAAVVNVSWDDAMRYCQWLSQREKRHYRLPTEAEWEYACRAGTTTYYHYGDVLPNNYQQMNADFLVQMNLYVPDKQKAPRYYVFTDKISLLEKRHPPNAWGLYDMHGNAQEWCLDWYAPYNPADTKDPLGRAGNSRVIRGGAFSCWGRLLRSANRSSMLPWMRTVQTGFRVAVGADMEEIEKIVPLPEFAVPKEVKPYIDPSYNPTLPLFEGPTKYVKIPSLLMGPLYSAHNHDSGIACLPNGDVLAIFYSTVLEGGCELAVASSRLKAGAKEWATAEPFFDTADMNDHAPAIFVDGNTVYHFNLTGTWNGSVVRTSTDNGYTWTQFRPYCQEDPAGQPNESIIKARDGRLLGTLDGPNETSEVVESKAHGNTWKMLTRLDDREHDTPGGTGKAIAGIHTAMVELSNGDLLAFGRVDNTKRLKTYHYKLPESRSKDGGKTWTYRISEFPAVTSGQRMTMKRLKEGPILLCSFSDRLLREKAEEIGKVGLNTVKSLKSVIRQVSERDGIMLSDSKGGEFKGFGLFAALSWDDGKTWPVQRLIVPKTLPMTIEGTDGGLQRIDVTHAEPNGYLAMAQGADGRIHLHSSRNDYVFNLAWLTEGTARRP